MNVALGRFAVAGVLAARAAPRVVDRPSAKALPAKYRTDELARLRERHASLPQAPPTAASRS